MHPAMRWVFRSASGLLLVSAAPAIAQAGGPPPEAPVAASFELPVAAIDDTLDVSGTRVAARELDDRLTVPVQINGRGPFRFVVDSGADRTVIGSNLAASLDLPASGSVRLHDMTGVATVATTRMDSLRLGSSTIDGIVAPALPERFLGADGALGIDALVDQRLKLDYENKSIVVEDARIREVAHSGDIVVVGRRLRGQLILTAAAAGGVGLLAVLDTGAEVTVGNRELERRILGRRRPPQMDTTILTSVTGGVIKADRVVVPEIVIGGLRMRDVEVAFVDAAPFELFGIAGKPSLLLGSDVLRQFRRVTLDFRRRRVRFTLKRVDRFAVPQSNADQAGASVRRIEL